jgi:hypothetical protein
MPDIIIALYEIQMISRPIQQRKRRAHPHSQRQSNKQTYIHTYIHISKHTVSPERYRRMRLSLKYASRRLYVPGTGYVEPKYCASPVPVCAHGKRVGKYRIHPSTLRRRASYPSCRNHIKIWWKIFKRTNLPTARENCQCIHPTFRFVAHTHRAVHLINHKIEEELSQN